MHTNKIELYPFLEYVVQVIGDGLIGFHMLKKLWSSMCLCDHLLPPGAVLHEMQTYKGNLTVQLCRCLSSDLWWFIPSTWYLPVTCC
jgi:hypothetical protein